MENNCKGSPCDDQGCPSHYSGELDLNTKEGQDAFEQEARIYATITSEANAIAPLINQTFKVTFKGSNEAKKRLDKELTINGKTYEVRGKEFDAEIDWSFKMIPVVKVHNFFGTCPAYIFPENLRQIGLLPKMLDAHKQAYGHLYL